MQNTRQSLGKQYFKLAKQADKATAHHSLITSMPKTAACQAIVALGPRIIPLLLKDLVRDKDPHWRMAIIRALAEQHGLPEIIIPDKAKGKVSKMAEIFILWGSKNGFLRSSKK